jgi:hypothetical protein
MNEEERSAVRKALLSAMSEWSEDNYCAGWLIDLESRLHREGGMWETLGRMVGWPIGCDAEDGWETWDEAAARYKSEEWVATRPWLRAS